MKKRKSLLWILIAIGLYSLSRGVWYNYQSLWLQENGFSINTISMLETLSSLGMVSVSIIFFNHITKKRLKNFIVILLFLKIFILTTLFIANGTGSDIFIKILILYDNIINTEILVSFYPLLTLFKKDDKLYGKKTLIDSSLYDIGVILGCFFLGKNILSFDMNFNMFLLLSLLIVFVSFIIIKDVCVESVTEDNGPITGELFSFIKKDKLTKLYFNYLFWGNISFYIVTGLNVLLLTNIIGLSVGITSTYIMVISIVSDIVGIIILKKLTLNNNYLNILIKFGGRTLLYLLVFLIPNNLTCIIALSYALLFSNSYSHVTDAPYTNRIDDDCQLAFSNIKNMVTYTAKAIGVFICGLGFTIGIRYTFLLAFILVLIQTILAMRCNYLLKEKQS